MKRSTIPLLMIIISTVMMITTVVYATEKENEGKESLTSESHRGPAHMQQMHQHMDAMHAQMQAIHAEKDPEKRQQLMQAHRQSMHEGMKMMHGMRGHGRMGMMQEEKPRHKKGDGKMDQNARMEHMEHRMDMMQRMMNQMMQHEEAHRHHHASR